MGILKSLRTYADRRLSIPVGKSDLVLDIGGGDQPHWRADVIVDQFPEQEHSSQRYLGGGMRIDRPVFAVSAGALPSRTKSFDYVICSHTLEHVPDPAAAVAEMCRVGKRGYIEVPEMAMAKIKDFPTHLWWCAYEDGVLVFRAKTARAFDPDIERLLGDEIIRKGIEKLERRNFEKCIIALRWENSIEVLVDGDPNMLLASWDSGGSTSASFT